MNHTVETSLKTHNLDAEGNEEETDVKNKGQSKAQDQTKTEEQTADGLLSVDEEGRKPRNRTRSITFSISSRQASKTVLDLASPTQNVNSMSLTMNRTNLIIVRLI